MGFIFTLLGLMFTLDAIWLGTAFALVRSTRWRIAVFLFGSVQIGGLIWLVFERLAHPGSESLWLKFWHSLLFLWHMIVLPLALVSGIVFLLLGGILALVRLIRRSRSSSARAGLTGPRLSRRQVLAAGLAVAPPFFNLGLAGIALRQLEHFRIRRFVVPIANLPPDLNGLTIVQVSDMHVGRFTSGRVLREVVRSVNDLRADLVLLTGDLINDALADLDHGLALVREMQARAGVFLIEGNHDLIENPAEFERRARDSGIPFLRDESAMISIHGAAVQLLGLRWTRSHENRDAAIAESVRLLARQRRTDAFPILLAHHPHAFDAAAAIGLPLVLSGHTHGGQLMLSETVGFGPALFRYWSGLYTRAQSRLIVSNGVGNWFPLRIRAPAELVHITLVRTESNTGE